MPSGTASRHIAHNPGASENPINAIAVSSVLTADTTLVPNRAITRALSRLDTTVPQDTITVTKLPNEIGSAHSA